jgi:hypothetical protein
VTEIHISLDAEAYPMGIDRQRLAAQGVVTDIGLLRHGTDGGAASVALVITLPSGKQVLAETTWKLFKTAYLALEASPVIAEETW